MTVALARQSTEVQFQGSNMQPGDFARWVNASAGCDDHKGYSVVGSSGASSFAPLEEGMYYLCYKWRFQASEFISTVSAFTPFPDVRMLVMRYDEITPYGTAPGCVSRVTITGSGFVDLFPAENASTISTCIWDGLGSNGTAVTTQVTSKTDTTMVCETPSPSVADLGKRLKVWVLTDIPLYATELLAMVSSSFVIFDANTTRLDTPWPQAAPYNLDPSIALTGYFDFYGAIACRMNGQWVGELGAYINSSMVVCPKPLVPDTYRADMPTAYSLEYSANGQCFAGIYPDANVSFGVYNALLTGLTLAGVPEGTGVSLELTGEGFISFPASTCTFQLQDEETVIQRPLVSVTDQLSACYFYFDNSTDAAEDGTGSARRRLAATMTTARTWQVATHRVHASPLGSPTCVATCSPPDCRTTPLIAAPPL